MCALMPRSELISTPKTRSVFTPTARRATDYWVDLGHIPPTSSFKDDKLPGLLRVHSQIM